MVDIIGIGFKQEEHRDANPKFLWERNVLCPPGFSPGKVKEQGILDHFPKGPAFIENVLSNL